MGAYIGHPPTPGWGEETVEATTKKRDKDVKGGKVCAHHDGKVQSVERLVGCSVLLLPGIFHAGAGQCVLHAYVCPQGADAHVREHSGAG